MSPATPDATEPVTTPRVVAVLPALFVVALCLRPQLVGIGPLLPRIQADLSTSFAWSGLLATIPILCMGVFAPAAPLIGTALGTGRALTVSICGVAVLGLARALAPTAGSLLMTTVLLGMSLGIAGALLPMVVKQQLPDRPAVATGVYAAGIQLGAAGSALGAVPLADRLGGWRGALVVFSVLAGVTVVVWLTTGADRGLTRTAALPRPHPPWRSPVAWVLAAVFALQSIPFYGLVAWMPAYFVERGWSETTAGALLSALNIAGLVGSLSIPRLMDRLGSRRAYLATASIASAAAIVGMLSLPRAGWLWAILAGLALAVLFALGLVLPLDVAVDARAAGSVSALVLGVGYSLSALAPSALGFVRDVTASFGSALWTLVPVLVLLALLASWLSPTRLRRARLAAG